MSGKSLDEVYRRIESERQQRIQQNILKESRAQELSEMVRQELLRRNRMYEFVNNNNSSSAAAGAGGGGSLKSEQNIFSLTTSENMIFLYMLDGIMNFVIYDFTNNELNGPTTLGEYRETWFKNYKIKMPGKSLNEVYFISKHDRSGIYLEVTSNVEYILGYNESDLLGKTAYDFFNPKCHLNIVRSHVSKNTETVRYQIRNKNDDYIWAETTSYKISDGNIYCITRKLSFFEIIIENIRRIKFF